MKSFQIFIIFFLLQESMCNKTAANDTITNSNSSRLASLFQNFERLKERANLTNGIQRRQDSDAGALMDQMQKQANDSGHYYEPYWEGGEHVFLRTTKSQKWKAKQKYSKTIPVTYKYVPWYTGNEMGINRDCYRDCPKIHSYDYGRVCGYKYSDYPMWELKFMEFENMCALEQENCQDNQLRPGWMAIHRGVCPELTTFKRALTHKQHLIDNAKNWLKDIEQRVSEYEARIMSAPTTDSR